MDCSLVFMAGLSRFGWVFLNLFPESGRQEAPIERAYAALSIFA